MENFADVMGDFRFAEAIVEVPDASALAASAGGLFDDAPRSARAPAT